MIYRLMPRQPTEEDLVDSRVGDPWLDENWLAIMREAKLIADAQSMIELSCWVAGSLPRARIAYDSLLQPSTLLLIDGEKQIELRIPKGISYDDLPPAGTNIYSLLQRAARYRGREFFDEPLSGEEADEIKAMRGIRRRNGPIPRFVKQADALLYILWVNKRKLMPHLSKRVWIR